jgi:hypothetical protein
MKFIKKETFYWVEDAQLLDMTGEVMADIWTYKFKQLKILWPELSQKLLRKMRTHVDADHLKWVESFAKRKLEIIQNPVPLLNKVAQSSNPEIEEFKNDTVALNQNTESQRTAISLTLNMANPQQVLEYCQIQESKRVAEWILINLHQRVVSIDKLAKQQKKGSIKFGSSLTDLNTQALSFVKRGIINDRIVEQAENQTYKDHDLTFLKKLKRIQTSKNKRSASLDHISDIPIFLYASWCGLDEAQNGCDIQPPPLCFFSGKALASYCAIRLRLKQSDKKTAHDNVRKWLSRLCLKPLRRPIIKQVSQTNGIHFWA